MNTNTFVKKLFFFSIILLSGNLFAQSKQERKVDAFTKIDVSSAITVYLSQGSINSVTIETDASKIDKIITKVSGGKLIIKREEGHENRNYWHDVNVVAYVTVIKLDELKISGSSSVKAETPIESESILLNMSGASHLKMELIASNHLETNLSGASFADIQIKAKSIDSELSGASTLKFNGNAENQKIETSGASSYKAFDLLSKKAEVEASGASNIEINVNEEVRGKASGASSLKYKGNPTKSDTDASGGSSIKKVN